MRIRKTAWFPTVFGIRTKRFRALQTVFRIRTQLPGRISKVVRFVACCNGKTAWRWRHNSFSSNPSVEFNVITTMRTARTLFQRTRRQQWTLLNVVISSEQCELSTTDTDATDRYEFFLSAFRRSKNIESLVPRIIRIRIKHRSIDSSESVPVEKKK